MVSHTQHRDDEVEQGKDAVEPQEAVPVGHKNSTVIKNTFRRTRVFLLWYFLRLGHVHSAVDLHGANICQCCSSKVLWTVSCRNNKTCRRKRDSFNLVCDSEETPLHLSGGWVREPNLTAKKKNLVVFITSAISVKCHIKVKHLTCVLTHSSDLAPLCFLLSWQPVNMSFNDGVTQWAVGLQLDAIKVFSGTARFLVDPITSPAFVAVWNDWLRATAKLFCCCYTYGIAAGFCVTSQSRRFPLKGNVEKRSSFCMKTFCTGQFFLL